MNEAAASAIKFILRNGSAKCVWSPTLQQYLIEYALPNGKGATWDLVGKFIGFRKP